MLLFLYLNNLPWQNEERINIKQMKINVTTVIDSEVFIKFLNYSKSLNFVEKPDYQYLKQLIIKNK
jgi:hypothetical protein